MINFCYDIQDVISNYNEIMYIARNNQIKFKGSDVLLLNNEKKFFITLKEKQDFNVRKIISRMIISSNNIALNGRVGPGTDIILSPKYYYSNDIQNMFPNYTFHISELIEDNTILVCRLFSKIDPIPDYVDPEDLFSSFVIKDMSWEERNRKIDSILESCV